MVAWAPSPRAIRARGFQRPRLRWWSFPLGTPGTPLGLWSTFLFVSEHRFTAIRPATSLIGTKEWWNPSKSRSVYVGYNSCLGCNHGICEFRTALCAYENKRSSKAICFSEGSLTLTTISAAQALSSRNDGCPCFRVIFIRKARTKSGILFPPKRDDLSSPSFDILQVSNRPDFRCFNFFRNSNEHTCLLAQI